MNIIKRELRANLKPLLIWSGCIIALIAIMMKEFEGYYDNPEMADVLKAMPEALMTAFAMTGANLTTLSGFISMASFYFYILLGIFAVLLGSGIISKEERDKTAEFLLTLPVSRPRIILSKLAAAVINCLLILGVTGASIYITSLKFAPDDAFLSFFRLLLISLFILQTIFLSLGMCTAAVLKRYRQTGNYSVSILLITYIISVVISLYDKLEFLKYITPFKYFEARYLLNQGELELKYLIISAGIIAASLFVTFLAYPKRNLQI